MDSSFDMVVFLLFTAVPAAYLVLQIGGLIVLRGGLGRVAKLCALAMGALLAVVAWGVLVAGSNLAPIWVVFALPVLTAVLGATWLVHAARALRSRRSGA